MDGYTSNRIWAIMNFGGVPLMQEWPGMAEFGLEDGKTCISFKPWDKHELVEKVLLQIAVRNTNVVADPEPRIRFRTFGDSSLNFELLCWAEEPALRGRTIHELNSEIYRRFNEAGIRIPFPQRDVHIYRDQP